MHIADGIVTLPVLAGATTLAVAGVAIGLAKTKYEQIPQTAVLSASFFVASLIHVPIGPGQVHLVLNGLAGLILGWSVFPALLIALMLQAILFGYGGITVLGVNTLNMALPGVICYYIFRAVIKNCQSRPAIFASGFILGGMAIAGSATMIAATLYLTNHEFIEVAYAILLAHIPIIIIEGAMTGAALVFLKKVIPQIFN